MAAGLEEADETWGSWTQDGKNDAQQDDSTYLALGYTLEEIAAWRKRKAQRKKNKERKKQKALIEKEWIVVAS